MGDIGTLPRLLEDERVEVRLVKGSTHVLNAEAIDALVAHLQVARAMLSAAPLGGEIRNQGFATTEYGLSLAVAGPPLTRKCLYEVIMIPKMQY